MVEVPVFGQKFVEVPKLVMKGQLVEMDVGKLEVAVGEKFRAVKHHRARASSPDEGHNAGG